MKSSISISHFVCGMSVIYGNNKNDPNPNCWIQIRNPKMEMNPFIWNKKEEETDEKQMAAKSDNYMREPDVVYISDNSYEDEQIILRNGLNELLLHPAFHY